MDDKQKEFLKNFALAAGVLGAGFSAYSLYKASTKSKKKVFISFDYDNDEALKNFLVGQSRHEDSPFDFVDGSIKQALTGDWKEKAKTRIKGVDLMIVICGERTHTANGVSAEVAIAQEENVPYFLLGGYSEKTCTKPTAAKTSDSIYKWTWDNLKSLIGGNR